MPKRFKNFNFLRSRYFKSFDFLRSKYFKNSDFHMSKYFKLQDFFKHSKKRFYQVKMFQKYRFSKKHFKNSDFHRSKYTSKIRFSEKTFLISFKSSSLRSHHYKNETFFVIFIHNDVDSSISKSHGYLCNVLYQNRITLQSIEIGLLLLLSCIRQMHQEHCSNSCEKNDIYHKAACFDNPQWMGISMLAGMC